MADGYESLGKASLDLEANLTEFERNMRTAEGFAERLGHQLDQIIAIATGTREALRDVRMGPGQAAESRASASAILEGVKHISEGSLAAAHELDRVRLTERQAAESEVPASLIGRLLERITRKANEARRAIESVRIVGGLPGRTGVGVGPIGSGFGRVGLLGAAVATAALLAPAAGPGAAGLLAAIPGLAFTAVGALAPLVLAFRGVGKAIKGDKDAFKELSPEAQKFVQTVRSLHGWLDKLKQTAAKGLMPGLTTGLRAALSPGTASVLTKAVGEMSQALGAAFAQWGRYFGSPKFQALLGPLMHAGARSVRVLSDAMLHLFDAFAVLGRAAIPFTNWLNGAIDRGARLASTWMRAKEASGALGRGLNEAKTSLRLVGGLFRALLRATGALGRALYPVSKVAVKQLTDGLNALARIINRNRATIREIVGGALAAFVSTVRVASRVVGVLFRGLNRVVKATVGWKRVFEIAFGAWALTRVAKLTYAIGTPLVGALTKVVKLLKTIAKWEAIDATLGGGIGGGGGGGRAAAKRLARRLAPLLGGAGILFGAAWGEGQGAKEAHKRSAVEDLLRKNGSKSLGNHWWKIGSKFYYVDASGKVHGPYDAPYDPKYGGAGSRDAHPRPDRHPRPDDRAGPRGPVTAPPKRRHRPSHDGESPFGKPPPFKDDKRGRKAKPPVIPAEVTHLEALAAQEASMAAAARTAKAKRKHLERELADLRKADRLLHERYAHAHGRARTRLYAEITRVENAMRRVRAQIRKQLEDARRHAREGREAQLKLAVDRAKLAVANAKEGTAAYDRAVKAEEKALRAEIAYYDKLAHNAKLSAKARDRALRAELAAKKELAALQKKAKHPAAGAGANIAQFLETFAKIQSQFAPNAFPIPPGGGKDGKTDAHLHDLVHESRRANHFLRDLVAKHAFPATGYAVLSAGAVVG